MAAGKLRLPAEETTCGAGSGRRRAAGGCRFSSRTRRRAVSGSSPAGRSTTARRRVFGQSGSRFEDGVLLAGEIVEERPRGHVGSSAMASTVSQASPCSSARLKAASCSAWRVACFLRSRRLGARSIDMRDSLPNNLRSVQKAQRARFGAGLRTWEAGRGAPVLAGPSGSPPFGVRPSGSPPFGVRRRGARLLGSGRRGARLSGSARRGARLSGSARRGARPPGRYPWAPCAG